MRPRILPLLENQSREAVEFVADKVLQLGHILPPSEALFKEYFPASLSYFVYEDQRKTGLFNFRVGRDKASAFATFRLVTTDLTRTDPILEAIEKAALTREKLFLRTRAYGYQDEWIRLLTQRGYRVGAKMPGMASLEGQRYDFVLLYRDLSQHFKFKVKRKVGKERLYPSIDVEKPRRYRFEVRAPSADDLRSSAHFANHPNVYRTIGTGVFTGQVRWDLDYFDRMIRENRVYPLACYDQITKSLVGRLDLWIDPAGVMGHVAGLGMFVKAEFQGLGVGTKLMEGAQLLAKRLHLAKIWLSVFETNTIARRLYTKAGFKECGRVPGWFQEGYVDEIFMVLNLA